MKRQIVLLFFCLAWIYCQAQNTQILPTPQQVEYQKGEFEWDNNVILTYDVSDTEISQIVEMFREDLKSIIPSKVPFSHGALKGKRFVEITKTDHINAKENKDQAYKMVITESYIHLEATTATGLFYATQSLKQLYRCHSLKAKGDKIMLPCMTITDWPSFKWRGWQDDISRGPIVTMDYLKQLIPVMAEYKVNFFSLYTEHTFKTKCHPDIAPIDAFTADEIKELEAFCKPYHMQIIGNQQCFAHFEEILSNPFYEHLADTKWNLNPADEDAYTFLEKHLKEVTKAYKCQYFNINCDETESLGQGRAKPFVDSIGAETVYYRHINRVNQIIRNNRKRALMWGDIAASHPEILDNLDSDITLIAWSYVALDNFDEFLQPYVDCRRPFMVAPGVSLSGNAWPDYHAFSSNITHLCRDGYRKGAIGVMNTCWDDFGESLTNNAIYGLALGAEMSWNPITHTDPEAAKAEEEQRHTRENFSANFFGCHTKDLTDNLFRASELSVTNGIGRFTSMAEPMLPFYPSQVGDSIDSISRTVLSRYFASDNNIEECLCHDQKCAKWNANTFDNALYAVHRIKWCIQRDIARCQLHKTYLDPSEENIAKSKRQINQLIASLHQLKVEFTNIWQQENRNYWLDVNLKKYDDIAIELQNIEYLPLIETRIDDGGRANAQLRTLYNNKDIYFTIDGKSVEKNDELYAGPIAISQSCIIKAACFAPLGKVIRSEKYILSHKGLGKLKQLNSPAGNYRPEYSGGGDLALLDGNLGSNDYKDGRWQGFYGIDADIEINLRATDTLHHIEIGFLVNEHDWIMRPDTIEIYTSSNGTNYKLHTSFEIQTLVERKGNFVFREKFDLPELTAHYLKIVVKNPGLIPEGLPGSGYESWIFMDEIIIE